MRTGTCRTVHESQAHTESLLIIPQLTTASVPIPHYLLYGSNARDKCLLVKYWRSTVSRHGAGLYCERLDASDTHTSLLITAPQTNSHLLIVALPLRKTIELGACHLEQCLKLFWRQMALQQLTRVHCSRRHRCKNVTIVILTKKHLQTLNKERHQQYAAECICLTRVRPREIKNTSHCCSCYQQC